jgi:WD40 repeat protein
LPDAIGPYRIVSLLGEGGMGVVYLAEQTEPIRRRVALKVIKLGMDTRQVVARFEAERHALALMDHPNIARVIDAGTTADGRPYFVMEYVAGVPITEYCDAHRLSMRARLGLLTQICGAVQHAHQKGVIHRDLKPSNVLVAEHDGAPVPKVIDFGIAKAMQQTLTERTLTEQGQYVGTPEYMSPEQAGADRFDADSTTDIYSLGVMLYELLVGALPFDAAALRRAGYEEMRRIIREDEPPKPSTRITASTSSDVASHRQTDIASLRRQLAGDLDWITLKAIEKDRTRRYASASELAADIGRYLNDEAVLASPPSAAYRAKKFVRRNRLGVVAAGLVAGALLIGLVVSTLMYLREGRARRDAVAAGQQTLRAEADALRQKATAEAAAAREAAARKLADDKTQVATDALASAETNLYFHNINLIEKELAARNLVRVDELLAASPPRLRNWEWHYLSGVAHREDRAFMSNLGSVIVPFPYQAQPRFMGVIGRGSDGLRHRSMAVVLRIDPAGERVFGASGLDLSIADLRSGRVVRKARFDGSPALLVVDSVFSADGRVFAATKVVAGKPGTTSVENGVWDVETGRVLLSVPPPMSGTRIALNESGTRLFTWSAGESPDGSGLPIRVWDIETKSQMPVLTLYPDPVNVLALSADGTHLAVAGDGTLRVLDAVSGREIMSSKYTGLPGPKDDLLMLAWSQDAARLVGVFPNHGMRLWTMPEGKESWTLLPSATGLRAGSDFDFGTAFTPDGRYLVTAKEDHLLYLIDSATGRETATFSGNTQAITALAFSPTGSRFVSSDEAGVIRVWTLSQELRGPEVLGATTGLVTVEVSDDERYIATLDSNGRMAVFDTQANRRAFDWSPSAATEGLTGSMPHTLAASSVAVNRHGSRVVAASLRVGEARQAIGAVGYELRLFDVKAGSEITTLKQPATDGQFRTAVNSMKVPMLGLVLAPTGDRALVVTEGGEVAEVAFWNIPQATAAIVKLPANGGVNLVRFADDGRLVALVANNFLGKKGFVPTYAIYDTTTGRRLHVFSGSWGLRLALAATGDFGKVASLTGEKQITLWDPRTGAKLLTVACPSHTSDLAFSPDGSRLVALSREGAISVFDTAGGRQIAALRESEASSVREWIVAGKEVRSYPLRSALHFSRDGKRIVLTAITTEQAGIRVRITTWNGAPLAKRPN